jgi:hypothetical protein
MLEFSVPPGLPAEPTAGASDDPPLHPRDTEVRLTRCWRTEFELPVPREGGIGLRPRKPTRATRWRCSRYWRSKGIVNLADPERLFPAPLGLSGQHNRRAKEFADPSRRATDTTSIPRPLKLTMRGEVKVLRHLPDMGALATSSRAPDHNPPTSGVRAE